MSVHQIAQSFKFGNRLLGTRLISRLQWLEANVGANSMSFLLCCVILHATRLHITSHTCIFRATILCVVQNTLQCCKRTNCNNKQEILIRIHFHEERSSYKVSYLFFPTAPLRSIAKERWGDMYCRCHTTPHHSMCCHRCLEWLQGTAGGALSWHVAGPGVLTMLPSLSGSGICFNGVFSTTQYSCDPASLSLR